MRNTIMDISQYGFGERLSDLLVKRKISQQELAAKLGISQATISYWMTGKREPKMENLKQLSIVLGVSVDWLVGMPKAGKGNRAASRATGLSMESIESLSKWAKSEDQSIQVADKMVRSLNFRLLSEYIERVRVLAVGINKWFESDHAPLETEADVESVYLTMRLWLLEIKETREKIKNLIDGFTADYTDYEEAEKQAAGYIDTLRYKLERMKSIQSVSLDEI